MLIIRLPKPSIPECLHGLLPQPAPHHNFLQPFPSLIPVFTQAQLDQLAIHLAKDKHEEHKKQGGIKRGANEAEIEESDGCESGP